MVEEVRTLLEMQRQEEPLSSRYGVEARSDPLNLDSRDERYSAGGDFLRILREAVKGDAGAQHAVGIALETGRGVARDEAAAARWYFLAADQGVAKSQLSLGIMSEQGRGVPESYVEAFKWYNLAAAQGDKEAAGFKENLRKSMTPEQIAEAQRLSAEWKPKQ